MRTKLEAAKGHYRAALAALELRRADYYNQIRVEHDGGKSLRALEKETELSFQRIHQIVNGK